MKDALGRITRRFAKRRKLIVCSFFLPDQRGHYFNELLGYRSAARELGLDVRVLVPQVTKPRMAAALKALRVLGPGTPEHLDRLWRAIEAQNPRSCDLVLFASADPQVIGKVGDWLERRTAECRPSVFFRIVGDELIDSVTGRPQPAVDSFRWACSDLRRTEAQERVFLIASNQAIIQKASRICERRVFSTPLPKYLPFRDDGATSASLQPRLYINLNAKSGSLIRILPATLRRVRDAFPDAAFIIKTSYVEPDERAWLATEIGALAEFLPEEQRASDYLFQLSRSTVALLAYEPQTYQVLHSGVFTEAASYGKPVIVPAGTAMAELLAARHGVGTTFDEPSAESLAGAVLTVLRDHDGFCAEARSLAPGIRRENSSHSYLKRILALSREMHDQDRY